MQAAKSLIHGIFDQAFNQGKLTIVDELVAIEGVTPRVGWGMPISRMGLKQLIATFRIAFPDLHCTIEDEIYEGDKFATYWTMRGTHRGSFLGNRPTGRSIMILGIIFARIENERIAEGWILVDQMGVLQQLGIVPPPRGVRVQVED